MIQKSNIAAAHIFKNFLLKILPNKRLPRERLPMIETAIYEIAIITKKYFKTLKLSAKELSTNTNSLFANNKPEAYSETIQNNNVRNVIVKRSIIPVKNIENIFFISTLFKQYICKF
jgi:hypothetical protein